MKYFPNSPSVDREQAKKVKNFFDLIKAKTYESQALTK